MPSSSMLHTCFASWFLLATLLTRAPAPLSPQPTLTTHPAAVCAYAPVAQEMHEAPWPSQQDLQEWRQRLDVKEAELQAALERLEQCQQHAQSLAAKGVATVVDVTVSCGQGWPAVFVNST